MNDLAIHRSAQHKLITLARRRHIISLERRLGAGIGDHLHRRDFQIPGARPFHRHVFISCRICQTSNPVRRIFSSSAAVFRTIIRLHRPANLSRTRDCGGSWLASTSITGRRIPEKFQHRPRLPLVRSQPLADHRLAIVLANHQFLPIQIAQAVHFRRLRSEVIKGTAARTLPASHQPGNNYIVINREMNHHLARSPLVQPAASNRSRLRHGARISVQNKPLRHRARPSRSSTMRFTTSSETSAPACMGAATGAPDSRPAGSARATCPRSKHGECPNDSVNSLACVPLPEPGEPNNNQRIASATMANQKCSAAREFCRTRGVNPS